MPRVSVVIPTFERPGDVTEAVQSVRRQTFSDFEIIVVVDGEPGPTVEALEAIGEPRLRLVVPDGRLGNAEARNRGIRAARGELIALLDDDDLWMPEKLQIQIDLYDRLGVRDAIVCCRFRLLSETEDIVLPRRLPGPDEPLSEYLFCRKQGVAVEGAIQTSNILAARSLFEAVPFDPALPRLVDRDWLLRAAESGATVVFPDTDEPLSVYAVHDTRKRVSHELRWRWQRDWALERKDLFTPRSLAAFFLTATSQAARDAGEKGAFVHLLRSAYAYGRPSAGELMFHTANTALPPAVKRRLATLVLGGKAKT
jgi:glycosyltransferase involved in cell wall biosynthesis